jgi:MinD-like ATPase involved in chromosome partitioning or flagellar assembly
VAAEVAPLETALPEITAREPAVRERAMREPAMREPAVPEDVAESAPTAPETAVAQETAAPEAPAAVPETAEGLAAPALPPEAEPPAAMAAVTAPEAPAPAPAPAPVVKEVEVAAARQQAVPSVERALSGPSRDLNGSWHGKVKIVTGNGAAHGPGARDQEAMDRNRARLPVAEPKRILILGCTSGAGQSVTALMTGAMLASLREHPVAAVDLHDGTLARYRAPAAWLEELLAGRPPQTIRSARPDGLHPTPKPSPARLDVVASHETLRDGDEIKLAVQLNRHYPLTVLDPGAAGLTRLLRVTDQLVVVVPANVDAAGALADTRDWLDNNGHADLAMQSVTVINGVSRRSLPDVEQAESIARGRSRAIVRVPWDDMLPVAAASPSTLRPQTRVAYTALAGVLMAGLSAAPVRKTQ